MVTPGPSVINVTNVRKLTAYPDAQVGTDGTGQVYGFHEGGVNAVFGDGSIRFIRRTVSIKTFAARVTRNGNEVIVDDFYTSHPRNWTVETGISANAPPTSNDIYPGHLTHRKPHGSPCIYTH